LLGPQCVLSRCNAREAHGPNDGDGGELAAVHIGPAVRGRTLVSHTEERNRRPRTFSPRGDAGSPSVERALSPQSRSWHLLKRHHSRPSRNQGRPRPSPHRGRQRQYLRYSSRHQLRRQSSSHPRCPLRSSRLKRPLRSERRRRRQAGGGTNRRPSTPRDRAQREPNPTSLTPVPSRPCSFCPPPAVARSSSRLRQKTRVAHGATR
jgi:hypothetical protein